MKSIGTKLALKIAIALIVTMGIFGAWDIFQQKAQYKQYSFEKQARVLQHLSLLLGHLLFDVNEEQIKNVIQSYLSDPEILSIKVLEGEKVLIYMGKTLDTEKIVMFTDSEDDIPQYTLAASQTTEILYADELLGTFEVVFSQQSIIDQTRHIIFKVSRDIFLLIIIEFLVVLTLARKGISLPLLEISRIAGQVAEGNVNIQVNQIMSQDEIGTLSRAFKSMITYFQNMAEAARKISTGDLREEIRPRSKSDELGQAFFHISDYLNQIANAATAIAAGDLRKDIQPRSEHDILGNAFQQMKYLRHLVSDIMEGAAHLRAASEELKLVSSDMASSTKQTSQQTYLMSQNSRQISENVDAVAVSIEEFSSNIREISRNTLEVANIVSRAVDITTTADTSITELETQTQEIGEIIGIISAITQQTNLLALNASIEAARAGDAGRGFAVVANEIKELSRETASSTEGIIQKLEAIQTRSKDTREAINNVSKVIAQVRDLSDAIASGTEEQSATTQEIAQRIVQAAKKSQGVTQVTTEVATAAQKTSEGAERVDLAANELTLLADRLQQFVAKFQI